MEELQPASLIQTVTEVYFNSSVQSNSLNTTPNIGLEKLQAMRAKKEARFHLKLLKNRIARLIDKEEDAKRKIEQTERRACFHEQTKQRYYQDQLTKRSLREEQCQRTQETFTKAQEARHRRKEALEAARRNIFMKNRALRNDRKREAATNQSVIEQEREQVILGRKARVGALYLQEVESLKNRSASQADYELSLQESYQARMAATMHDKQEDLDKMQRLAELEAELLEKLSSTLHLKEEAANKLQSALKQSRHASN